MMSFEGLKLF